MPSTAQRAIHWVEQGLVPDAAVRLGIRRLLRERLVELHAGDPAHTARLTEAFLREVRASPVVLVPEKANEQHYELPPEFFAAVLGRHRKYSSAYWPDDAPDGTGTGSGTDTPVGTGTAARNGTGAGALRRSGTDALTAAEAAALAITCDHADLRDGQSVLELGCGWGSLSLWVAERYPASRITAVSNAAPQRLHIEAEAARRGLANLHVVTCDMNVYATDVRHDRIVSIEMFEHLRNWPEAFRRVAGWLRPDGKFFMHVFAGRAAPYPFIERDASDWMARHFFTGGMMPSDDLAARCQDDLRLIDRWNWNGGHYARTAEAWLANMDAAQPMLAPLFSRTYGAEASVWWVRWRVFFLSCAELFAYDDGWQWYVAHHLFERRG